MLVRSEPIDFDFNYQVEYQATCLVAGNEYTRLPLIYWRRNPVEGQSVRETFSSKVRDV
jgi:hypothetical protein